MASERSLPGRVAGSLLALALLTTAPSAHADPSPGERDAARSLMDLGDRKVEARDYPAALKAYEKADTIMGVPTTGIEVARTLVRMRQLVEGWERAEKVARFPRKPSEPEAFTRARAEAEKLASTLAPQIPTLWIRLEDAPPGAQVTLSLDGNALPTSALASPRKVNPGLHEVVASIAGVEKARAAATVTDGQSLPLVLHLGEPRSADGVEPGGRSSLLYVGIGLGGAGLLTGAITGALSLTRTATIKGQCPSLSTCPPGLQGEIDSATMLANVSNVGFAVLGAGAALTGVGVLVSGKPKAAPAAALQMTLGPLPGGGIVGASGRF